MQARFGSRTADLVCMGGIAFCALVLLCSESVMEAYTSMTAGHPFFMGFCKFALLATLGECLALRLTKGVYVTAGFGLIPRAVVWGCLGVAISAAFMIFSAGAPVILHLLGMEAAEQALSGPLGTTKILTAFSVSLTMNTMFAPIMMIAHKVADLHIAQYQGRLACLWNAPQTGRLLQSVDWNSFWKNVLCRSLLWFWIPVHTVTFFLPPSFRVLFAAVLGAILGLLLALLSSKQTEAA
ncbi:hydrolase [Desulfovibrio piger]|uniref:hydrolase n=1 Tax=Desulfovibrio piger TaxID=901 RepID=UPI0026ED9066|nr:hydrolase [Desulfovibrio piger]